MIKFLESKIRNQIDLYRKRKKLNALIKEYENTNKKVVFLLQTPTHTNIGDHAIAQAQINFIKLNFSEYVLFEINQAFIDEFCEKFVKVLKPSDLIALHGGGNMGDQYLNEELPRRKVVSTFLNNKIIVFPQTMFFTNTEHGKKQLITTKSVFSKHPELTLISRELISFELMKREFPENSILLTPDIVLSMNMSTPIFKREGVLLVLRNDVEKMLTDSDKSKIIEISNKNSKKVTITDMHHDRNVYSEKQRREVLRNKFAEFKQAEVVVTDRLHGMIFAAITETPCIAFSNYNQKVSGTYEWIKQLNYIKFVDLNADINLEMQKMLTLKEKTKFDSLNLSKEFEKIKL